jgi:membrane protein implicated in regulation of membrane protease activity
MSRLVTIVLSNAFSAVAGFITLGIGTVGLLKGNMLLGAILFACAAFFASNMAWNRYEKGKKRTIYVTRRKNA